ncbi:MAG TPA: hypothetical protein VFW50_07350 [Streptosporangiaceae bacterium]|nr:hypothetical protein [Streptosporangiaceae bacterium]
MPVLGIKVAASTVWEILQQAGMDPAPERTTATWASFPRSQADALLACDFFETRHLNRGPPVRAGGYRARQPPDPGSGRNFSSHCTQVRPRPRGTWSWISRTPGAEHGS